MKVPKKTLQEINEHTKTNSLLVVSKKRLKRVYCPFKAVVRYNVDYLMPGEIVTVESVKMDVQLLLIYSINHRNYHYYYFEIIG